MVFAKSLIQLREFDPSWVFSTHLPPASGGADTLLANVLDAPNAEPLVGPDQAALETMLREFEPA
jgi:hypothetical protein